MTIISQEPKPDPRNPKNLLVTGCAGFIGSNLVETMLGLGQKVTGLDNFSTEFQYNLDQVEAFVGKENWKNFELIKGDIRGTGVCAAACRGKEFVLHQAALGSVPRSVEDPLVTNENNIIGFLNMLVGAKAAKVKRFVYAASSSTYGDHPGLPKQEDTIGRPLSPYAVTKYVNELYAKVFASTYGFKTIGLRYFNVFGKRQDPYGGYAAVMPLWFSSMIQEKPVFINGDGETSRDFCYIDNCVQANLRACLVADEAAADQVYNVAYGERTTLNELFYLIRDRVAKRYGNVAKIEPIYRDCRPGDVRHSLADISKAKALLGYQPKFSVTKGLDLTADWYMDNLKVQ